MFRAQRFNGGYWNRRYANRLAKRVENFQNRAFLTARGVRNVINQRSHIARFHIFIGNVPVNDNTLIKLRFHRVVDFLT